MTLPYLVNFPKLQQPAFFLSERRTNSCHVIATHQDCRVSRWWHSLSFPPPIPALSYSTHKKQGPVTIMDWWCLGCGAAAPVDPSIVYATGQVPFQSFTSRLNSVSSCMWNQSKGCGNHGIWGLEWQPPTKCWPAATYLQLLGYWFSISRMCQDYYSVVRPRTIPGRLRPPWGVSAPLSMDGNVSHHLGVCSRLSRPPSPSAADQYTAHGGI